MIEFLEPRIAPAGLIDVVVSRGNVVLTTVTGVDGDESAVITLPSAGSLTITPGPTVGIRFNGTTSAPGLPLTVAGFTGDLRVSLGGGNDSLTLDGGSYPGDVSVNLGDGRDRLVAGAIAEPGRNFLFADGVSVGGAFSVKAGRHADTIEITGNTAVFGGPVSVHSGSGVNSLLVSAADTTIAGSARFSSGGGSDLFVFKGAKLLVEGALSISSGAGSDTVQFTPQLAELSVGDALSIASAGSRSAVIEQTITGVAKVTIGGALKMKGGTGDRVTQSITGGPGTVGVGGSIDFSATNPTVHIQALTSGGAGFEVEGFVRFTSRAITADQTLSLSTVATPMITGDVALAGGIQVVLAVAGQIGGDVRITTAAGRNATVSLSDAAISGAVRVVTRDTFGHTAAISLEDLGVQGDIAILSGIGASTLRVNQLDASGRFVASLGDGQNQFRIEQDGVAGNTTFHGAVVLTGGRDADTFLIAKTGNDAVAFLATVIADGRAGIDTVAEGEASSHPAGLVLEKRNVP
jgi:hypothetical protein